MVVTFSMSYGQCALFLVQYSQSEHDKSGLPEAARRGVEKGWNRYTALPYEGEHTSKFGYSSSLYVALMKFIFYLQTMHHALCKVCILHPQCAP